MEATGKPIIAVTLNTKGVSNLSKHEKVVTFGTPEEASRTLARLAQYATHQRDSGCAEVDKAHEFGSPSL
jgi:hypothetical protein